jgi:hypothetical protein
MCLPGVGRWTPRQRADLVRVIKAKGGISEIDFVRQFDRHQALRRALRTLAG